MSERQRAAPSQRAAMPRRASAAATLKPTTWLVVLLALGGCSAVEPRDGTPPAAGPVAFALCAEDLSAPLAPPPTNTPA